MKHAETRLFSLTRKQQYGITILTVVMAMFIRLALDPILGGELPFFFFVFPLVISSALGGLGPGLLATGLSLVLGDYLFIEPRKSLFALDTPSALTQALSVAFVGVAFSLVFDWTRRAAMAEWLERKAAQERIQFLLDLSEALLPLADADQIIGVSVRMLGEHLRADRCEYAEAEAGKDHFAILASFSGSASGEDRSVAAVPLKRDGSSAVKMSVYQKTPRRWSDEELWLINIVANRCWESAARARAVKRLADSDERYRAFVANTSEGIWRYELDNPIPVTLPEDEQVKLFFQQAYTAQCNEAFARMHGRSSVDEILGERVSVLFVRSDAEKIIEYARTFVRSHYHLIGAETREQDPHGNTRYFLSNLTGILEKEALVRIWGTQQDITERKQAEATLRETEERFSKAFRASPDSLVISRVADGMIIEVNESFISMTGYSRDELVGHSA